MNITLMQYSLNLTSYGFIFHIFYYISHFFNAVQYNQKLQPNMNQHKNNFYYNAIQCNTDCQTHLTNIAF